MISGTFSKLQGDPFLSLCKDKEIHFYLTTAAEMRNVTR